MKGISFIVRGLARTGNKLSVTRISLLVLACLFLCSCHSNKELSALYSGHPAFSMKDAWKKGPEHNFQSYREAASGAVGAKAGGGCGCY